MPKYAITTSSMPLITQDHYGHTPYCFDAVHNEVSHISVQLVAAFVSQNRAAISSLNSISSDVLGVIRTVYRNLPDKSDYA